MYNNLIFEMAKNEEYRDDEEKEIENIEEFEEEYEEIDEDELAEKAKIKRYGSLVLGIVTAVVVIFAGWNYWQDTKNEDLLEANIKLQKVLPLLSQGSYENALKGGVDQMSGQQYAGLESIAGEYSSLEVGKTASFYAAKALMETGQAERSISYFKDATSSESEIIRVGAFAGLGKAYELNENWADAATNYEKAADNLNYTVKKSKYLFFSALAYEKAGNNEKSEKLYKKVLEINVKNTSSDYASQARAGLARLGTNFEL